MTNYYFLVIDNANGKPKSWFSLDYPEDSQIMGNLESHPNCHVNQVTREELERHFELEADE